MDLVLPVEIDMLVNATLVSIASVLDEVTDASSVVVEECVLDERKADVSSTLGEDTESLPCVNKREVVTLKEVEGILRIVVVGGGAENISFSAAEFTIPAPSVGRGTSCD